MEARMMKNDLTCGVVRDLLPSYVENLLGEESREAVERHLEGCPDCTAKKEAMTAPTGAEETAEAAKEVDFLVKVKKRSAKRVVLAVVCTAAVLLLALVLKVFVIGTPLQAQSVAVLGAHDNGAQLWLALDSVNSGNAFCGWKLETVDGVTSICARDVLSSPLHHYSSKSLYVPLEGVREVWLGGTSSQGRLLWAEGTIIDKETLDLVDAKTPYCGDAPALGRIAELLQVGDRIGRYTTSLQTSERPYRWTLEFQNGETTAGTARFLGYQMLALVENLDEVCFRFPSSSGIFTSEVASNALARVTEEHNAGHGADWPVHESVKEYAESPLEYQRMVTLLEEMFLGTSGTTVTVVKP